MLQRLQYNRLRPVATTVTQRPLIISTFSSNNSSCLQTDSDRTKQAANFVWRTITTFLWTVCTINTVSNHISIIIRNRFGHPSFRNYNNICIWWCNPNPDHVHFNKLHTTIFRPGKDVRSGGVCTHCSSGLELGCTSPDKSNDETINNVNVEAKQGRSQNTR